CREQTCYITAMRQSHIDPLDTLPHFRPNPSGGAMRTTFAAIAIAALATASYSTLAFAAPSADEILAANKAATGVAAKPAVKIEYAYSGQGMTGKVTSLNDLKSGRWVDDAAIGPATETQGFDGAHA